MKGDTRCIDGRVLRHDPQPDDPDLETDIGECGVCDGNGRGLDCAFGPAPADVVHEVEAVAGVEPLLTFPPLPPERRRMCPICGRGAR